MGDITNSLDENGSPIEVKKLREGCVGNTDLVLYDIDLYNVLPKEKSPDFEIKVVLRALRAGLPLPFFKRPIVRLCNVPGNLGVYIAFNSGFFDIRCPIKIRLAYFAVFCAGCWEPDDPNTQKIWPTFRFVFPSINEVLAIWNDVAKKYKRKRTLYTRVRLNNKEIKQGIVLNLKKNYIIFETVDGRFEDKHTQLAEYLIVKDYKDLQRIGLYTEMLHGIGMGINYQTELHIVPKNVSFYVLSCTLGREYHITDVYHKNRTLIASHLEFNEAIDFLSKHVHIKRPQ